jgi:hypothetical protein
MRRPHKNRKWFGEHLGPLKRWLCSQVGRPWNDVYSEASSVIKPDSVVRLHVRTHLLEFVERNTFMKNGEVWYYRWLGMALEVPIMGSATRWHRFYVHPENGVLLEIPRIVRPRKEPKALDFIGLTKTIALRKLNGIWFECTLSEFPTRLFKGDCGWRWDFAEGKMIGIGHGRAIYGSRSYCSKKLQLSKHELKRHGLSNGCLSADLLVSVTRLTSRPAGARNGHFVGARRFTSAIRIVGGTQTTSQGGHMQNQHTHEDSSSFRKHEQTAEGVPV